MPIKQNTTSSLNNWWLATRQPPVVFSSASKNLGHRARTKYIVLKLTKNRSIKLSIRNFKTSSLKRSEKYKQIILPVYRSSTKEVAIRLLITKKPGKISKLNIKFINPLSISYSLMLIGLVGALIFVAQFVLSPKLQPVSPFSSPQANLPAATLQTEKPKGLDRSVPTRLVVSSIGVDTGIMEVGRLPDGSMETPPLFENITGWYRDGPSPGQIGPAIIAGHVDTYKGPSVFWNLRKVQPNDQIQITRADGAVVTYLVTALKQFEQNNFPTQEVYGNTDDAELRLITCAGSFDRKTQHYSQNTVVFARILPKPEPAQTKPPIIDSLVKALNTKKLFDSAESL